MELGVIQSKETIMVSDSVFGQAYNPTLVHQVVVAYQAGGRQGSKAQKSRSDVRGGGAKPWRQKGTGRARAGTIRSPIWVGGGRTFAATPRDFSQKVNRKMYRSAIRAILSQLVKDDRLMVLESLALDDHKTKTFKSKMKDWNVESALFVSDNVEQNVQLASRNIIGVNVIDVQEINPVVLLKYPKVIMTKSAIAQLEERLA